MKKGINPSRQRVPDLPGGQAAVRIVIEHLGRAVYGGFYEPGTRRRTKRFSKDVTGFVEAVVRVVRYPGGKLRVRLQWEDGVGPRARAQPGW
jgi:alpha-L-arabinofuranosidase